MLPTRGANALHVYAERADDDCDRPQIVTALNSIVDRTAASGLYLVITIGGGGPGWLVDEDGQPNEANRQFAYGFWDTHARAYAGRTHVIFEIHNEAWFGDGGVAQPSPPGILDFELTAYEIIRKYARETPVLLFSYAYFHDGSGVLADVAGLNQRAKQQKITIDWSRTAIAFHGYSGAGATKATLLTVTAGGIEVMETELGVAPDDARLDFAKVDAYETTRTSWFSFLPWQWFNDQYWNDPIDAASVIWAADAGAWPGSSNPPTDAIIAMRSPVNGLYVRVDEQAHPTEPPLIVDAADANTDAAQLTVEPFGRYVALLAKANGRYVQPDAGNRLVASSPTPYLFEWIDRPNGRVTLQAKGNWLFVAADYNVSSQPPLVANRTRGGGPWEAFDVDVLATLTVTLTGDGFGTVTSSPDGIDCESDCSQSYLRGTQVTLTQTPQAGSIFAGWSSDCLGGQVTMTSDRQCTATFTMAGQAPFLGAPFTIDYDTTRIDAELYDLGGEGVAYHDTSAENVPGHFRDDGVDIETRGAGYAVAWTAPGEWLEYTVDVTSSGLYDLRLEFKGNNQSGARIRFELDGVDVTGDVILPYTGGAWQEITVPGVNLTAGEKILRLFIEAGGFKIDFFELTAVQQPFLGAPFVIDSGTTRIDAELYDLGGEGIAYHDTSAENVPGHFRADGVDIETRGAGYAVAWTAAGEWLEYTVDVAASGLYDLRLEFKGNNQSGARIRFELDGVDVTGTVILPPTGGAWQEITVPGVNLTAGPQKVLRLFIEAGGFKIDFFELFP